MKTVIITGATRGLGLAIAKQAIIDGYRVIAIGRKLSAELDILIKENDNLIFFEQYDLYELDKIQSFVTELVKQYGRPWALINNAATSYDGILATQHEKEISALLRLNIEAPILFTKYIVRSMLIERAGRIINVSSIISSTGFSGLSVYAATKAAMIGFTRSLAREVGKASITVNAIAPGYMETDMTSGLVDEKLAAIRRRSPLGHLAEPLDVAHAAIYLLSEQARNVTGVTITIDAGSTA